MTRRSVTQQVTSRGGEIPSVFSSGPTGGVAAAVVGADSSVGAAGSGAAIVVDSKT